MTVPSTLADIRTKVRKITGRPSTSQITDTEIDSYINTFYIYDMPEHLRMESLRVNYEFSCTPNIAVYDFPINSYLTVMPPVFIAGYRSYMTQSRENFFRVNPQLNFLQESIATSNGTSGTYTGTCTNLPLMPGFKPNPPGAYSDSAISGNDIAASNLVWNVIISADGEPDSTSGIPSNVVVVDDGQGNLFAPFDSSTISSGRRGTIDYITGTISLTNFVDSNGNPPPSGNAINIQYIPYVASRPQSCVFYQDQIILYPVPDRAYTVSFEVYKYPTALASDTQNPQLNEWWQMLAYGAADKIFADNADFENLSKFRPLLEEQMRLMERRTIVQQTSERTATIYTEQVNGMGQFPFGNLFNGL